MEGQDLLSILEANFGKVRIKGNYAYICSPFNESDKNPSCSVVLTENGKFTEGFFKDFSTGKSGNIYSLLGIKHKFNRNLVVKKLPQLDLGVEAKFHMSRFEYAPSKYLFNRGISYDVQRDFKVNEKDGRVSMPVFDKDGYFLYDVSRLTTMKGYANSAPTEAGIALLHAIKSDDCVFVCESMIDSYTFFTVGLKAVSLNSATNHSKIADVFNDHYGKIVLALDPDKVGRENASLIMKKLMDKDVVNLDLPFDVNQCWTEMLKVLDWEEAIEKFKDFIYRQVGGSL